MTQSAYRASLLTFAGDPGLAPQAAVHHEDGVVIVEDGRVSAAGAWSALAAQLRADATVHDRRGKLIVPGFIDTHIHFPQTDMIASPAPGLLPWLETYTFPTERRFEDRAHAEDVARFFVDELLACGTTTALVYCTVHPQSADALFAASHARNVRMVAGKVLMDRHCPEFLRDTAQSAYDDSAALIGRWHNRGRQLYALTPRFAPTSTEAQLEACGALARKHPDVFIQSHVAENADEVKWVADLFPGHRSYLDVYDHYGLLRRRAVYGHCIWLDDHDRRRMAQTGALAAHCPTSNLFLGSGLFDFDKATASGMPVSLATDVGGGTSFSMLQTMNEAHKVARMGGHHLSATRMFWLATAGAAAALDLADRIGTLAPASEADFVVLDPAATPLLARRTAHVESLEDLLFAFALLGDDRAVYETYAAGERVHGRDDRDSLDSRVPRG
ncbi:guanine deaminase [Paraburkholderia caballeronis]|uniref:Guanine deaminase n=1 Tax=Paraburkholderia caballeronis TaxID=416943 RepID=A0A1H7US09_9BURK|nr:guanine deaminase [Paraburkholderia caballeronis]PXW26666.1 guanine deaminase [Paraburkholderia caballeronis]PXX02212.1 guanine deaminase [Paraburkholderia caballeronis]RAK01369.1 guanine deaminase [Paraburkholderia caballeronis]SEB82557.1 guanine deaminase [Paraburkholderia caballeronis]SEL99770.1 guanine deaminase [Paraburkholderia caballeronis]